MYGWEAGGGGGGDLGKAHMAGKRRLRRLAPLRQGPGGQKMTGCVQMLLEQPWHALRATHWLQPGQPRKAFLGRLASAQYKWVDQILSAAPTDDLGQDPHRGWHRGL